MCKYKVVVMPALEVSQAYKEFEFSTAESAVAAAHSMADLLLFIQDDLRVMKDYSNVVSVQLEQGGEWIELDDEELQQYA